MSTIEECHLTNEKNPPKMLNYAKRRLSHAGFEMTQQQMPGGARGGGGTPVVACYRCCLDL